MIDYINEIIISVISFLVGYAGGYLARTIIEGFEKENSK